MTLKKCVETQNITCADDEELWEFLIENKLMTLYTDMFVDLSANNNAEIVKPMIEDRIFYGAKKGVEVNVDSYVQPSFINSHSLNPFNQEKLIPKFKMGLQKSFEKQSETDIFRIKIRHDHFKLMIKKSHYSVNTLLAEIIGLYKFEHIILFILTLAFRRASFMNTILGKLFMKRVKVSDEQIDYLKLEHGLKTDQKINKHHLNSIVKNMLKERRKFELKNITKFVFLSYTSLICPFFIRKKSKYSKLLKQYEKATMKYNSEMDIVNILRTIRLVKMYM